MPPFWIACEGPALFLLYCVVLWLTSHVQGHVQNIPAEEK
jgi:hypothetical protein